MTGARSTPRNVVGPLWPRISGPTPHAEPPSASVTSTPSSRQRQSRLGAKGRLERGTRVRPAQACAVKRAMDAAHRFSVEQLFAFATAAVRDATNREQIVERIAEDAGVKPQFLS